MINKKDELLKKFLRHVESLEKTRDKMEILFNTEKISKKDIEQVYKGLFLDMVSGFELIIENIFVYFLIEKQKPKIKKIKPIVIFKNNISAKKIIFNNKRWVDWLPYVKTIELAGIYFLNGYPFSVLGFVDPLKDKKDIDNAQKVLEEISIIRNAIAHQSNYSKEKFLKSIENYTLLPKEKTPIGFLRSNFRISPIQNRFQNFELEITSFVNRFLLM
ncbi:MAG: hypothetical protein Q8P10_00465 [bacterium]|nr:hypothetical protein [bacterium]